MLNFFAYLDTVRLIPDPASKADTGGLNHEQMETFPFKK